MHGSSFLTGFVGPLSLGFEPRLSLSGRELRNPLKGLRGFFFVIMVFHTKKKTVLIGYENL